MKIDQPTIQGARSWSNFDDWHLSPNNAPTAPDWSAVDGMVDSFKHYCQRVQVDVSATLAKWDNLLSWLGGDPIRVDWTTFRPLRLYREEDWSDWFSFLLASSKTGVTAHYLFGQSTGHPDAFAQPPRVERETSADQFRGDVLIWWSDGCVTHIEIKIGDPNLRKTYDTAEHLENRFRGSNRRWMDFIVLLPLQRAEWDAIELAATTKRSIHCRTWEDVSIGLRRGILSDQSILWKSFARAFIGAIEQTLLQFRNPRANGIPEMTVENHLRVLREGQCNE